MKAQEALNSHPTAKVAYVNAEGEWHFSTPPKDFVVVQTLKKGEEAAENNTVSENTSEDKRKRKLKNG